MYDVLILVWVFSMVRNYWIWKVRSEAIDEDLDNFYKMVGYWELLIGHPFTWKRESIKKLHKKD